jgi:recombination protein RecT
LRNLLERSKEQIALALPKHLTPERMIRVALTAVQRSPKLLECDPLSVLGCVIQASELGLELSGPLGQAYMVPYWNSKTRRYEAQFQAGYKGLIQLAHRSGEVIHFSAHCVHANDHFSYAFGTSPFLKHVPAVRDRGPIQYVYAVIRTKGGGSDFEVMSSEDVEDHRKRFSKQKTEGGPWDTSWEEMAKKTVLRRLAKRAPVSVECQKAAAIDEYAEAGILQPYENQTALATAERAAMLRHRLENLQQPEKDPNDQVSQAPTDEQYCEQAPRDPGEEG